MDEICFWMKFGENFDEDEMEFSKNIFFLKSFPDFTWLIWMKKIAEMDDKNDEMEFPNFTR